MSRLMCLLQGGSNTRDSTHHYLLPHPDWLIPPHHPRAPICSRGCAAGEELRMKRWYAHINLYTFTCREFFYTFVFHLLMATRCSIG